METTMDDYLEQFMKMVEESGLGASIKNAQAEYSQMPLGMATFLKCVTDKYRSFNQSNEMDLFQDLFCQLIILAYHEGAKSDNSVADSLVESFIKDFPGVPESCIQLQAVTLGMAAVGFKETLHLDNRIVTWIMAKELVLTYNEFLNALLGFVISCLRCGIGKPLKLEVFNQSYNSKIEQLNSLTGGDDGLFYLIGRIAKPKIRNAIAHCSIWYNADSAIVSYVEGTSKRNKKKMKLLDFVNLARIGSFLIDSYLVAISAIAVFKDGTELAKSSLPKHLRKTYEDGVLSYYS